MCIAAAAVIILTVAAVILSAAWHKGAFLPAWIEWKAKTEKIEAWDGGYGTGNEGAASSENKTDGKNKVLALEINLTNKQISAVWGKDEVWISSDDVLVQDFLMEDIDHDGYAELMLLCWKIGKYGNIVPKFGDGEEYTWSQHIYIYDLRDGGVHAIWMASDIGMDVLTWEFGEESRLKITETNGDVSYWDWLSWGLERVET